MDLPQPPARHKPVLDYLPQQPLISESGRANSQPNSPLLKIELEECSIVSDQDSRNQSKDNDYLLLSPTHCSCPITQLSQSPRHSHYRTYSDDQSDCFPPHYPLEMPSSPLLVAMRDAVDSLNKYEDFKILEKIGAGFFAEVYKVVHIPTEQEMVLKINKRMTGIKKLKEVELLKKLHHPNILHYVGACVHEGQLHPLTEFMNGGALEQLIQNVDEDFSWPLRLSISLDIAKGMTYLHKNDMFHRDLNSKNVLLRKQGSKYTAVVADFGLAAKTPNLLKDLHVHRQQSIVGNPYWMAPEVLRGKAYNEKADVFSYGIVLCEIITRLDADPDNLRRRNDYGMDEEYVQSLLEARECPKEFMKLAFQCCKISALDRPTFPEIMLLVVHQNQANSSEVMETIQPQPSNRLSFHSIDGRPRSRSNTPDLENGPRPRSGSNTPDLENGSRPRSGSDLENGPRPRSGSNTPDLKNDSRPRSGSNTPDLKNGLECLTLQGKETSV